MGTGAPNIPRPINNPTVWCGRCKRHHKYYTFTQDDYDAIIKDKVKELSDCIDRRAMELFYEGK